MTSSESSVGGHDFPRRYSLSSSFCFRCIILLLCRMVFLNTIAVHIFCSVLVNCHFNIYLTERRSSMRQGMRTISGAHCTTFQLYILHLSISLFRKSS